MSEPTLAGLKNALCACHITLGIIGAHSEAIEKLRKLRAEKFTWFFAEENNLRFEIDHYLDQHP